MYDDRTEFNREAKRLQTILDDRPAHEGLPEKPVDAGEITERIQVAEEQGREIAILHNKVDAFQKDAERLKEESDDKAALAKLAKLAADDAVTDSKRQVDELAAATGPEDTADLYERIRVAEQQERELTMMRNKVESFREQADRLKDENEQKSSEARTAQEIAKNAAKDHECLVSEVAKSMEPEDTAALYTMIEQAATTNRQIEENADRAKTEKELAARTDESDTATSEMAAIDAKKQEMIAGAKMPIDGLEFGDAGLLYNGVPLDEDHASSSELIRISAAIGFAQHPDPEKLRIMLIQDCSLLDEENLKMLCDMAEEHGVQCLLEVVGDDADVIMVDGLVSGEIKVD